METKLVVNDAKALAWCHSLSANGIEVKMTWDGGNDSGWANLEVGKSVLTDEDREFIEFLQEKCYDELDYGSWAGEFSTSGEAVFDPIEEAFLGVDYYEEDSYINADVDIKIAVPANLNFERLEVNIDNEDIDVSAQFYLTGGLTPEHRPVEIAIVDALKAILPEIIDKACLEAGESFRYMYEELSFTKDQFTLQGDQQFVTIDHLCIRTSKSDPRDIHVSLID